MSFGAQLQLFLDLVSMVYFHHVPVFNIKTENEERDLKRKIFLLQIFFALRYLRIATMNH